jgi:hypothetical protein
MKRRLIIALGLLIALSGCGRPDASERPDASADPSPQPSPSNISPIQTGVVERPAQRSTGDGVFELLVRSARQTWKAGEPIEVEATLTYTGEAETVEVTGSGGGLVGFGLEQLDGPLDVQGVTTSDCRPYEMVRGESAMSTFEKSGGWSDSDPNAAAIQAFLRDPLFRLPAGAFVVHATFTGYLGGCGGERHGLSVELPLTVVP